MHGPMTGKLVSEFLTTGEATRMDVSSWDIRRFAEGRTIKEPNVI
jgi:hypothetical protein